MTEQAGNHCRSPEDAHSPRPELDRPPSCKVLASKLAVDDNDGVGVGVAIDDAVDDGIGFGWAMAPVATTARSQLSRR